MRVRKEDYYMDTFIIEGGHPLNGEVAISGAKNAVLGIIPAAILCSCSCLLYTSDAADEL